MTESNGTVASEAPSSLELKIIRQIEYYFGDLNLMRDKFLQGLIREDDGWVTFETMLKFNRLNSLCSDLEVLAAAMRKSTVLMEVSEDGKKLRRLPSKPVPTPDKDHREDLNQRSIYAKAFPVESTLDELIEFFEKFGKTEQIQMRKNAQREFKGSVYVVYQTTEAAKNFIEATDLKYKDVELEKKLFKADYFAEKNGIKKKIKAPATQDEKAENGEEAKEEEPAQTVEERMTKGAILVLKSLPEDMTREDLKKIFLDIGQTVAWVDFSQGEKECRLRFPGEGLAQTALTALKEANDGKVLISDKEVEARILEAEEEVEHWKNLFESQKEMMNKKRKAKDYHRQGKRGNYKGFKKSHKRGKGSHRDDQDQAGEDGPPPSKQIKKDEVA
ncbi:hypothetical protein CAPTEDRAFT_173881 [Capitella teleta]|uniref:HTH La-type RNA-binding domain-containing protein n=1 Tax=Capitella teleta TaxID=283909 RepID=R7V5X7_CAPTE|nr:hypothetical protein CAPTEDRAFT_173881 [Capitella teleta]|eukprot:ELU11731.1 hypothetical protein CAPTEDRAFT_173881 [Capitella teleta]